MTPESATGGHRFGPGSAGDASHGRPVIGKLGDCVGGSDRIPRIYHGGRWETFKCEKASPAGHAKMIPLLERAALYALYQLSIALGILLLPVALLLQRAGITLPIHKVVERLDEAYANAG